MDTQCNDSSHQHARIFSFINCALPFFRSYAFIKRFFRFRRAKWTIKFSERDQPVEMNMSLTFNQIDRSFLSMCLPCETARIVEKLTPSSKRAAWNRSIYGPWGLRVQVLPPPLHATWRKYSAIGTVMFNMRPVYINYSTAEGQAFTCAAQDRNAPIDDRTIVCSK